MLLWYKQIATILIGREINPIGGNNIIFWKDFAVKTKVIHRLRKIPEHPPVHFAGRFRVRATLTVPLSWDNFTISAELRNFTSRFYL